MYIYFYFNKFYEVLVHLYKFNCCGVGEKSKIKFVI